MAANMASGLLAESGPGRGAGVPDKTQRVGSFAAVEAHPKHGGAPSQRKTLSQVATRAMSGITGATRSAFPLVLNEGN